MNGKTNLKTWLLMSVIILGLVCGTALGRTICVDADASPGGDGQTWGTAYKYLQDALAAAASGDEIWVAQGIYKPDANTANPTGTGDRFATFELINGVAIKGGYAGFGEPDPNAWDIDAYETILSGDLLGNDGPDFANNGENSYHVTTGSGTDVTAVLDGFTITGGNANEGSNYYGGGMYNWESSPTVTNCTFSGNSVADRGGGMYNWWSSPTLTNCTFSGNSASGCGGGMSNTNASPTVTNCTFSGNSASGYGGGMFNDPNSIAMLSDCTFSGNSAANRGGGMHNCYHGSNSTVTNCTFSGNWANYGGGMYNANASPTLTNCMFSGNTANYGGGMYNANASPTLTNCMFSGNTAEYGGGMYNYWNNSTILTNCTFAGNSATQGNALAYDSWWQEYPSNVQLANCILWDAGDEVWNNDGSTITMTYSDVQGGWSGEGNINTDPLFVDADGDDDIFGTADDNPRIVNGIVDMGAYEVSALSDIDGDGIPDIYDVCPADPLDECYQDGSTAAEIDSDEGGTLVTPDGGLAIDVGPGALTEDTTVSVTQTMPEDPEVDLLIGPAPGLGTAVSVYDLEPDGMVFSEPVTITVIADVTALNQNQRDHLKLYLYTDTDGDGTEDTFVAVPDEDVAITVVEDPPGTFTMICTAQVDHFSIFALVAPLDSDNDGIADLFADEVDHCPTVAAASVQWTLSYTNDNLWVVPIDGTGATVTLSALLTEEAAPVDGVPVTFIVTDSAGNPAAEQCVISTADGGLAECIFDGLVPDVYALKVETGVGCPAASDEALLVVFEPGVPRATGGGFIFPDAESTIPAETSKDRANFGFIVRIDKNQAAAGNLEFQYKTAGVNLKSKNTTWYTVSNNKAMFQGEGTINGEGLYTFRVHATDGELTGDQLDAFDIRIWEGTDTEADPIHRAKNDLAGGSIVIHKK